MPSDRASLRDIVVACRHIGDFTANVGRDGFLADAKTRSAVLYQLAVAGEAAGRPSPVLRRRHADIPWAKAIGMRNALIHGYDRVDLDIVWGTTRRDIPRLLEDVEALLPPEQD